MDMKAVFITFPSLQLHSALIECIQVSLASGSVEELAELFKTKGQDVNPKLKQLIGQVSAQLTVE